MQVPRYRVHTSPLVGLETGLLGPHRLTSGRHDVVLLCRYCITLVRCCQAHACQLVASSYRERPVVTLRLSGIRYRVATVPRPICPVNRLFPDCRRLAAPFATVERSVVRPV